METSYPQHNDYASSSFATQFSPPGTASMPAYGAVNDNAAASSYSTSAEPASAQPSSSRPTPSQPAPPTTTGAKTAAKPRRHTPRKPAAPKTKKTPVRKPRRNREDRIPTILPWFDERIESEMTLWCEGDRIRPVIMASCTKNLWNEGLSAPVTYRRNYVTVDSRYSFEIPVSPDPHKYANGFEGKKLYVMDTKGRTRTVNAVGLRLSALIDQYGGKEQPLTQHTARRDKGHEGNYWDRCVLPDQSGTLTRTPHSAARLECPDLKFQMHGYYGPSVNNGVQTELSWHRVQFKAATANNGSRRATQQYYHFLVSMVVDVSDVLNEDGEPNPLPDAEKGPQGPPTHRGKWLVIESRMSHRVIARGRSPNHYESSSPSTANASNGGGGNNDGGSKDDNGGNDDDDEEEDEGPEPDDEGTAPSGDRNNNGRSVLAAQSHNNRVGKQQQQQQRSTQQPPAYQAAALEAQLRQQQWERQQLQHQHQQLPQMQLQAHQQTQDQQFLQRQSQQMQQLQHGEYAYAPLPMVPMSFHAANQTIPETDVGNITTAFEHASMAEQIPIPEHTSMAEHTASSEPYDGQYFHDDTHQQHQHPSFVKDESLTSDSFSPQPPQLMEPVMALDSYGNYNYVTESGPSSSSEKTFQQYTVAALENSDVIEAIDPSWCSQEYGQFDAFAEHHLDL